MTFAERVESLPVVWKSRGYDTVMVSRAFFLRLRPGEKLHRHTDAGDCDSYHVVIATNPGCLNWWKDDDGEHSIHMEQGCMYRVNRTLEHWAANDGETDRIHLIIEL